MDRKWYHFLLQGLTWFFSWVYICTFLLLFNIFANGYWLIRMIIAGKLKEMIHWKKEIEKDMTTIRKVVTEISKFTYKFDGIVPSDNIPRDQLKWYHMWPTWIPLIIVYLYRGRKENCDGAETATRWLLRSLLKNKPCTYKGHIKYRKVIYVPYIPANLAKVHYFTVVTFGKNCELYNDNKNRCFSNGQVTQETKDQLAIRYLKGDARYIWARW